MKLFSAYKAKFAAPVHLTARGKEPSNEAKEEIKILRGPERSFQRPSAWRK
jgi:hypothetical protein